MATVSLHEIGKAFAGVNAVGSAYRSGRYRLELAPLADPSLTLVAEIRHRPGAELLHLRVEDAWIIPAQAST